MNTSKNVVNLLLLVTILAVTYACSSTSSTSRVDMSAYSSSVIDPQPLTAVEAPAPDPRVGLEAGLFDAGEAIWNLDLVSTTPPPEEFVGVTNSDLAFKGNYAIQGNYNGVIIWDISDPANPELVVDYLCPASQSDVSVYGDLLFVSGEGLGGRIDCGTEGVQERVSDVRLRGIRIFDISDIENPVYKANVQTCRGSHTHSVLKDPDDDENVYVYVSGSAPVRPEEELPGCSNAFPEDDPNSALFRIEVIKVPLDNPEEAAIVSSPRIFEDLEAPPTHGLAPADLAAIEEANANANPNTIAFSIGTGQQTITLQSGVESVAIEIPMVDDDVTEPDELFSLHLLDPTGSASIGTPGTAMATIRDDDGVASLPFEEGFETAILSNYWKARSSGDGRITITNDFEPAEGTRHVVLDSSNVTYALNELVLTADLQGRQGVVLEFEHKVFDSEQAHPHSKLRAFPLRVERMSA